MSTDVTSTTNTWYPSEETNQRRLSLSNDGASEP